MYKTIARKQTEILKTSIADQLLTKQTGLDRAQKKKLPENLQFTLVGIKCGLAVTSIDFLYKINK